MMPMSYLDASSARCHSNMQLISAFSTCVNARGRIKLGEHTKVGREPVYEPLCDLCRQCLELCNVPSLEDMGQIYKVVAE